VESNGRFPTRCAVCFSPNATKPAPSVDRTDRHPENAPPITTKAKEVPLKIRTVQIGMCTVVLLVVLRLSLGCHFFYEGVWKIKHADEFSAEPFLTQAKGPAAPLFHAMVPDLDGRKRLAIERTPTAEAVSENWRKAHTKHREWFEKELLRKVGEEKNDVEALEKDIKKLTDAATPSENELKTLREQLHKEMKELEAARKRLDDRLAAFDRATLQHLWAAEDKLENHLAREGEAILAYFDKYTKKEDRPIDDQTKGWIAEIGKIEKECHDLFSKAAKESTKKAPDVKQRVPESKHGEEVAKIIPLRLRIKGSDYLADWSDLKAKIVKKKYGLTEDQEYELEKTYRRYKDALKKYLADNQEDIKAYFGSLDRLQDRKDAGTNWADHEKERTWNEQQKLRAEAAGWIGELEKMDENFRTAAWHILDEDQQKLGEIPQKFTFSDFVDFAVTWGLTAIGFCLLLGLFTRPAALGGAAFMFFVLLTQPPWPTIYPPAPGVVGHALGVDRNFIELIALLVIASCAAGRWAGLDYFVEHYAIKWCKSCPCMKCLCKTDESARAADAGPEEEKPEKDPEKEGNPKTEKEGD